MVTYVLHPKMRVAETGYHMNYRDHGAEETGEGGKKKAKGDHRGGEYEERGKCMRHKRKGRTGVEVRAVIKGIKKRLNNGARKEM